MSKESRQELDAYRALEMARDKSLSLATIFKTTGGYRQSVVDARNSIMQKNKKSPKTKRVTKAERLRIAAEKTRPLNVSILTASGKCEVEITMLYNSTLHNRMAGIRADYYVGDPDDIAAPTVYMDNPQDLRILAQALLSAADWMEEPK